MPVGYVSKTLAVEQVRQRTGYGRRTVERKIEEMAEAGLVKLIPDPGQPAYKVISQADVEKVVEALTLPPPT